LNLSDTIDDLAPRPPPCFQNRLEWLEYLKSAAASQGDGESQKIILLTRGIPRINFDYDFCCDCTPEYRDAMASAGRCNPFFLKAIAS
jgi:hypothetical protein